MVEDEQAAGQGVEPAVVDDLQRCQVDQPQLVMVVDHRVGPQVAAVAGEHTAGIAVGQPGGGELEAGDLSAGRIEQPQVAPQRPRQQGPVLVDGAHVAPLEGPVS